MVVPNNGTAAVAVNSTRNLTAGSALANTTAVASGARRARGLYQLGVVP